MAHRKHLSQEGHAEPVKKNAEYGKQAEHSKKTSESTTGHKATGNKSHNDHGTKDNAEKGYTGNHQSHTNNKHQK